MTLKATKRNTDAGYPDPISPEDIDAPSPGLEDVQTFRSGRVGRISMSLESEAF
jgi:hypothetical protein